MVGRDERDTAAVDGALHVHRDAVFGVDPRAAGGDAGTGAGSECGGHRQHQRLDLLIGLSREAQVGAGGDVGVLGISVHVDRVALADGVARDGHTDGHTEPAAARRDGGRSGGDGRRNIGRVGGLESDSTIRVVRGLERAVQGIGLGTAENGVERHRTGTADRNGHDAAADRQRGGDRQRLDRCVFGRCDRDRAGAGSDIGVGDERIDAAVNGVIRERYADRQRNAGDAEGCGQ